MIRVLLVDDQELVRTGLRGILRTSFGFDVVGECADGREVAARAADLAPDVILMDVRMPFVDGVQATRELRRREGSPPVLALTTFDDDKVLAGILRAGAAGFVLKGVPAEDLQRAVRAVAAGRRVAGPGGHRPGACHLPVGCAGQALGRSGRPRGAGRADRPRA